MTNTEQVAMSATTENPAARIFDLIHGVWAAHAVAAATRLGIPDRLARAPSTPAELAETLDADADAVQRLLMACASLGALQRLSGGRFGLTGMGEALRNVPGSLRDMVLAATAPGQQRPFELLADTIVTGQPSAKAALGEEIWAYYRSHAAEGEHFAGWMSGLSTLVADQASGLLFDLPEVVAGAPSGDGDGRVEVVGGDFFRDVPSGGDLYVLSYVLHDWDDEHAGRILAACQRAAAPDATLMIVELVLPDELGPPMFYLLDLAMLVLTRGRERTRAQYEELSSRAGFKIERVTPLPGGISSVLQARRMTVDD